MLMKVGPNLKLLLSVWNILSKLSRRQRTTAPLRQALLPTTSPRGTSGHRKFQKTFSKLIMKTFVIGIGGVTNGGKTTLAKNLQKHLPNCSVISQDDFFKPPSEIETDKNGFLQYDVLEALNMEKMMSTISCWMQSPRHSPVSTERNTEDVPILIIEGFLLFNYKPLETIWNRRYFVTIPYEECKRRRSMRVYEPPDSPGYFDGHVWPMYLKHRREIEDIEWEIVYLDGTKSKEDLLSQVYEDLRQELAKQKLSCKASLEGSSA
ncbi:nicotinamide riboside kinase 1 isoform X4 [Myotis daubentonii]|uniref:nicotinamide riboside kinase 1 isoform X4 n=2 Tax=Myotis daubentonii TaxID=98922 RepID=UPI002873C8BC|nr:nicotinamide riboside kinase 1 isoform X4 [Myotis daubentonii]